MKFTLELSCTIDLIFFFYTHPPLAPQIECSIARFQSTIFFPNMPSCFCLFIILPTTYLLLKCCLFIRKMCVLCCVLCWKNICWFKTCCDDDFYRSRNWMKSKIMKNFSKMWRIFVLFHEWEWMGMNERMWFIGDNSSFQHNAFWGHSLDNSIRVLF